MNGSNTSVYNPKIVQNDLDNRRQAIGRTGRIGNDRLIDKFGMIASQYDVQDRLFLDGGTDHHLTDARIQIGLQGGGGQEFPGTFHDQFDRVQIRNIANHFLLTESDLFPIDRDGVLIHALDVLVPRPVDGIVLDQIGRTRTGTNIVDLHDVEEGILPRVPQHQSSDATITIQQATNWFYCSSRRRRRHGAIDDIPVRGTNMVVV